MRTRTIGFGGLIVLCALALSNPSFCQEYYCVDVDPLPVENNVWHHVIVWTEDDKDCDSDGFAGTFHTFKVRVPGEGILEFANETPGDWSCQEHHNANGELLNYDCTGSAIETISYDIMIIAEDPGDIRPEKVEGPDKKRYDPGSATDTPTILDRSGRQAPALSEWGLYILALLLMGTLAYLISRRQRSRTVS